MINFIFSTESTCDLPNEIIDKYGIRIAPVNFMIDNVEYSPNGQITTDILCQRMREGAMTKTFQVNEFTAKEYLSELLKEGKDIVHFSFSSQMSGTCDNFKKAAEELNAENDNKIYVVDTLCQSCGVGLLMMIVADRAIREALPAYKAVIYAESIKLNIAHMFTVGDLKYLARGGRISALAGFLGNVLTIKPILNLGKKGKIVQYQKVLGRAKSLNALAKQVKEKFNGQYDTMFIGHADSEKDALIVADKIKEFFPELNIIVCSFGATITAHCGPDTVAIFFTADDREEK